MKLYLTIDVEDWFHVETFRHLYPLESWDNLDFRVAASVDRLLGLLDRHGVEATFFTLGWVAEKAPDIVRRIHAAGHEVACHGHGHDLLTRLDDREIREDIKRAKQTLEDLIGEEVIGYRAPAFSITEPAMDILADLGFHYDSSLFPFEQHAAYGTLSRDRLTPIGPSAYRDQSGLVEFELPMVTVGKLALPWAGGGYFRLYPGWLFRAGVRRHLRSNDAFIFYSHPWEFDPGHPWVRGVGVKSSFRHYVGLRRTFDRLDRLVREYGGGTLRGYHRELAASRS